MENVKEVTFEALDERELTEEEVTEAEDYLQALIANASQNEDKSNMLFFTEPFLLDEEEVIEMATSDEFTKGKLAATKYLGFYVTLVSGGVDVNTATTMMLNLQADDMGEKAQLINKDMNIEMGKLQKIQMSKQSL